MSLLAELEGAIARQIKAEVARQMSNVDAVIHDQLHALPGLVTGTTTVSPLAALIDDRIAHFLKVELAATLAYPTFDQTKELIGESFTKFVEDELEDEIDRFIETRIEKHVEDEHEDEAFKECVSSILADDPDLITRAVDNALRHSVTLTVKVE